MDKPVLSDKKDDSLVTFARFHTDDVEPAFRYEAWRQNMGAAFDVCPGKGKAPPVDTRAGIEAAEVGGLALARTYADGQRFSRCEARLAADQLGLVMIQCFTQGSAVLNDQQRIAAGDMLVIDSEQPLEIPNTDFENITLMIPYDFKDSVLPNIERLHGRKISAENPMTRLVAEHLLSLWNILPDMNPQQAGDAARGALGLVQSLLLKDDQTSAELSAETSGAFAKMVRRYIEQHLAEAITVDSLTARFGLSRAQIYRMFTPYNGVSSYIWERRLLRSRRMLASSLFQSQSIGRIAFENGFSSEAHFSRAFRSRFGMTPSCARAEAMTAGCNDSENVSSERHFSTEVRSLVRDLAANDLRSL